MAHDRAPTDRIVFRSKLTMPQPRGLVRPRLLGALDGVWRSQMGLIVAPAGSGKTILAAQYATFRSEATAWLRAERADADSDRLLRHLVESVGKGLGVSCRHDGGLDAVLSALERWTGERALIVIDDVHLIDSAAALETIERLAFLSPPTVRLLAVGRAEPARLDLSRMRIADEVSEIAADDLRFRSWEIERLFQEVYQAPLVPDTVVEIAHQTGGWAAGLQLLHLAKPHPGATSNENRVRGGDLARRSRLLGQYLVANVLADLPPELRDFIRGVSALGLLTGEMCDRMLGVSGTRDMLTELERRQLCRPVPGGYRLLPLLQAHLDSGLRALGDEHIEEYRRAARLLERAGAFADALRAYARAGSWEDTGRLLRQHGAEVVADRSTAGWDDVLPADLVAGDPWLLLDAARRAYVRGRLHRASDLYERAHDRFGDQPARAVAHQELSEVATWVGRPTGTERPTWYACLRAATRARPLAYSEHGLRRGGDDGGHWELAAGLALLLAGHADAAETRLAVLSSGATDAPVATVLAATLGRLTARLLRGERPAPQAIGAVALHAEVHDLPWFARLARALLALGDRPDDRGEAAAVSLDCERDGDEWGALLAGLLDSWRRVADGLDPEEPVERAVLMARRLDAGVLECWARAVLALGAARRGDLDTGQLAAGAEAAARNAEVPGARALALAALAQANGPGQEETAALSRALLADCGMAAGLAAPAPVDTAPTAGPGAPVAFPGRGRTAAAAPGRILPSVEVRCFGGFGLRVAGHEPDLAALRPRARATLRLLALHAGQPVHRETLVEALWPDKRPDLARHGLQVAVSALRRLLEPGGVRGSSRWIAREGDAYVLTVPAGTWYDLREFTEARQRWRQRRGRGEPEAEAAALRAVLAAYGGDLLPEDGPAEWVVTLRERLRMEAAECATALGELEFGRHRSVAAAEALERAVRIDPFRDGAWRLLWLAYGAGGDVAAAARARREYARVLGELGLPVTAS